MDKLLLLLLLGFYGPALRLPGPAGAGRGPLLLLVLAVKGHHLFNDDQKVLPGLVIKHGEGRLVPGEDQDVVEQLDAGLSDLGVELVPAGQQGQHCWLDGLEFGGRRAPDDLVDPAEGLAEDGEVVIFDGVVGAAG